MLRHQSSLPRRSPRPTGGPTSRARALYWRTAASGGATARRRIIRGWITFSP